MQGERLGSKSAGEQFELLTAEEFAERLRVPASWVREQTRSRALEGDPIPHLRLGRQRNVRAALERIIERAGDVQVTASAVVAAVEAYAKNNASGQWIGRIEFPRITPR
jgi:hypothetical protein